jgi:predicted nucleic acid-binding protein
VITLILLDTGPLGLVTNPKGGDEARRCEAWLQEILAAGADVIVPALADYELRRELIRGGKAEGLERLENLIDALGYLPIDPSDLFDAAWLWADVRREHRPTAADTALDGDCILAAQSLSARRVYSDKEIEQSGGVSVLIATTNPKHLERFVPARLWSEIQPGTF